MYDRISQSRDTQSALSRRQFIAGALAGAGVAVASPAWLRGAESTTAVGQRKATDIVTLGRTGIKATRLAQGTGYNGSGRSSAHTRLGEKAFDELIRHSLDQGIRFIDMADLYGSHPYVRHAIQGVPRDRYIFLSKIWPRKDYWNSPSGGAKEEVNRFRKELNTDVIEICLIHCMTDAEWPQTLERIRDELSEMKDKGAVKAVGVSCHDLGALKVASTHPWVDVILARINNKGKEAAMDASVEEVTPVLKQARANGKVVLGMKIFGAGKLVTPEAKDASLKYVLQNNLVDAITVGMLSPEQVDDTIERMNKALTA
jgi:aryl-alcohol dehydrogenase-like predicted oxidoreductase